MNLNQFSCKEFRAAAHRCGVIVNSDSEEIDVDIVLFDSGASSNNFISDKFYKRYERFLEKDVIYNKLIVRVANGQKVVIPGYVPVKIVFKDHDKEYEAWVKLYILKGMTKDIIIGLPTICEHFSELFIKMIKPASNDSNDLLSQLAVLSVMMLRN